MGKLKWCQQNKYQNQLTTMQKSKGVDKQNNCSTLLKSKQAILLMYDENMAVEQLRKKCSSKPIWNNLPHQDLHNKLDMLERSFLSSKSLRDSARKQNVEKSQALTLLEMKMKKHPVLRGELATKVHRFMLNYSQLENQNAEAAEEINILRKQLSNKRKKNDQLQKLVENENKNLLRIQAQHKSKLQFQQKSDERYKLLYSD